MNHSERRKLYPDDVARKLIRRIITWYKYESGNIKYIPTKGMAVIASVIRGITGYRVGEFADILYAELEGLAPESRITRGHNCARMFLRHKDAEFLDILNRVWADCRFSGLAPEEPKVPFDAPTKRTAETFDQREYGRRWREEHKEHIARRNHDWYMEHREHMAELYHANYLAHKDDEAFRERHRQYERKWYQQHKDDEAYKERQRVSQARKRAHRAAQKLGVAFTPATDPNDHARQQEAWRKAVEQCPAGRGLGARANAIFRFMNICDPLLGVMDTDRYVPGNAGPLHIAPVPYARDLV